MIGIYHSRDLDGWCSGAIMKLRYPDIKLIGWDYGNPIPIFGEEEVSEDIIMADVSFPVNEMIKLSKGRSLTWIDHHKSAINEIMEYFSDDNPIPFKAVVNPEIAACELTWEYLFPEDKLPNLVWYLGMYDSFRHKGTKNEKNVMYFQFAARAYIHDPDSCLNRLRYWSDAHDIDFKLAGRDIYAYLCTEAQQKYANRCDVEFDGLKFALVNEARFNPANFKIDYHADGYDGFACYWDKDGQRTYSLYSDNGKTDCSEICKKRGGGGHFGAAGFQYKIGQVKEL